jgi:transposase
MRAARSEYDAPSVRKVDASDIGPQHPARHGQNDREIALGRKSWLFAGSQRGADRAAVMATLIITAKLNDVDPQAWLADVLARIAEHPAQKLDELLPWNWRLLRELVNQAA